MRFLKKKRSKLLKGQRRPSNDINNKVIFEQEGYTPFIDSTECTTSLTEHSTNAAIDELAIVATTAAVPSSSDGSVAAFSRSSTHCTTKTRKSKKNIATRFFHKVSPIRRREKKKLKEAQRRMFFRDATVSPAQSSSPVEGENRSNNNRSNKYIYLGRSLFQALQNLERHYFWGSSPLLQTYALVITAIFIRRLWILHGLYLVFVLHIALLAIKWVRHVVEGKEFSDICRLIMWAVNRFSDEADRALRGDGLRIWLAGASLQSWNKIGKGFVYHLLRDQCRTANRAMIDESKDKMERNETTLRKLLTLKGPDLRRNIADEITKRREDLIQFGSDVKSRGIEFRENMADVMAERRIELRYNVQVVQDTVQDKVSRLTVPTTLRSKGKG